MNFNSLAFLLFLPIVILVYWLLPHKFRWIWLLLASYVFYMSWNPWLIFLIIGTTLVSYCSAIIIEKNEKKGIKRFFLWLTIIVSIGALIFFKYFNFLIESAISFLRLFSLPIDSFALDIILPIGISFYTFQTLSYVIDVYKGDCQAEKHLGYYALFVCYFPQLIAGPIERPGDLLPQLKAEHHFNSEDFFAGLRILLVGFFYKCAVADVLGIYVNHYFGDLANATTLSTLIAGFFFAMQIYGDFAGYSEIATGSARMMGVKLTRNFLRPYMADSFSLFFREWHMSLTRWFTKYVYIPLGGSRKGKGRRIFATFVVFFLCGLWHGANWTYVIWGLYAGLMLNLEALFKKPVHNRLAKWGVPVEKRWMKGVRTVLLYLVLIPQCLIFRCSSVQEIGVVFTKLFTGWGISGQYFLNSFANLGLTPIAASLCLALLFGEVYIFHYGEIGRDRPDLTDTLPKEKARNILAHRYVIAGALALSILLLWVASLGVGASSAFQYFQF